MTLLAIMIFVLIILILISISMIFEPIAAILALNLKPKRFRLHKPKNESKYYLQIRVMFIWYYIYKSYSNYNLVLYTDNHSIYYSPHVIISKRGIIMDERFEIMKFFNDEVNPEDNIKL